MYCVLYINGGAEFVAGGGVSDIMECQDVLYVHPNVILLMYFGNERRLLSS